MKPLALILTMLLSSTVAADADTIHDALAARENVLLSHSLHDAFLNKRHLAGRQVELDEEGNEVLLSKETNMVKNAMLSMSPKEIRALREATANIHFQHAAELDQALKTMTVHQIIQLKQALRKLSVTNIGMLLATIVEPVPVCGQSLAFLFSSLHPLKDLDEHQMAELALQDGEVGRLFSEFLFKLAATLKHLVKPHEANLATQSLTHLSIDELLADVLNEVADYIKKLPMGGDPTSDPASDSANYL